MALMVVHRACSESSATHKGRNIAVGRPAVVKDGSAIKVTKIAEARDNLFIVARRLFVMHTRLSAACV